MLVRKGLAERGSAGTKGLGIVGRTGFGRYGRGAAGTKNPGSFRHEKIRDVLFIRVSSGGANYLLATKDTCRSNSS